MDVPVELRPLALDFISKSKANFLSRFGDWVHDASKLGDVFERYGFAQVSLLLETDPARLQDWEEVKKTTLLELDTLGLEIKIIGKVDARQFFRDEVTVILGYVPFLAGIGARILISMAPVPGAGLAAQPLGAGVQLFLEQVMGAKHVSI